eukprot:PhF_6_TR42150/c0_g1_i1/m.63691/K09598/SPPL3; signal peptide peptidase-like 3
MFLAYIILISTVCFVVYLASILTHPYHSSAKSSHHYASQHFAILAETENLFNKYILCVPVFSSLALLILYMVSSMYYFLLGVCLIYGSLSVYHVGMLMSSSSAHRVYAILSSWIIVSSWLYYNHWILTNTIAAALVIAFTDFIRLKSFRIACMLLGFIMAYDIFWVWFSPYFFRSNVMVEVAMRPPPVPLEVLPNISIHSVDLPIKFVFIGYGAHVMLGMGDVLLPSMVITYLRHCDVVLHHATTTTTSSSTTSSFNPFNLTYFGVGMLSYVLGLLVTISVIHWTESPQPAMVYLSPSIIGCVVVKLALQGGGGKKPSFFHQQRLQGDTGSAVVWNGVSAYVDVSSPLAVSHPDHLASVEHFQTDSS